MSINVTHGIPQSHATSITGLYTTVTGFTNIGTTGNPNYFGNIPLTFVNNTHSFFLQDSLLPFNPDWIYITLPYTYANTPGMESISPRFFSVTLQFANGIPFNVINAKYPIDIFHTSYYHIIVATNVNGYYINLPYTALASGQIGGQNVTIGQVSSFTLGYPDPNQYVIELDNYYKNVVSAKLVGSIFPNIGYTVTNNANKLYWQNYDDGSFVYNIIISTGYYTAGQLMTLINTAIYNTPRAYYPPVSTNYTNHNYIRTDINLTSNTTTFTAYNEIVAARPFVNAYYILNGGTNDYTFVPVANDPSGDPNGAPEQLYPIFILIHYTNHGLTLNQTYVSHIPGQNYIASHIIGDSIMINGTTMYLGIPSDIIDDTYEAFAPNQNLMVSATDYFMIKLRAFDIGQYTTRNVGQYGGIFNMYFPTQVRFLFDRMDTIGNCLGFPNVGQSYAITKYGNVVTNQDQYQSDLGNVTIVTDSNAINLTGDRYIMMNCEELPVIDSIGIIKHSFAIIQLNSDNSVCYNTYVDTPQIFYSPINELTTLTLAFYASDGTLYDFNGINHEFVLEITTLDELPSNININTHTGKLL
jgi:hypothetical protein